MGLTAAVRCFPAAERVLEVNLMLLERGSSNRKECLCMFCLNLKASSVSGECPGLLLKYPRQMEESWPCT